MPLRLCINGVPLFPGKCKKHGVKFKVAYGDFGDPVLVCSMCTMEAKLKRFYKTKNDRMVKL
jgi:hypothetical protein